MSSAQGHSHLKWVVFMTPGIPTVTSDMPPGVKEVYYQTMVSTLILGTRDAVLVDSFMTVKQANALADWVAASGKNLTIIYKIITECYALSYPIMDLEACSYSNSCVSLEPYKVTLLRF